MLAAARAAAGYSSQRAFAQKIGYSQQRVADWEAGHSRPPPEVVPTIARLLGLSPTVLLPPHITAMMEAQQKITTSAEVDEALGALAEEIHAALTEAGGKPSIRTAARLAVGTWRLCGGTLATMPDQTALRAQVQNLRELWADLARSARQPE